MNKQEPKYSMADIRRYLDGKMTSVEMHKMENAALDDPFLQDAIDGYSEMLNEINSAEMSAFLKEVENFEPNTSTHRYSNIVIATWQKKIMQYAIAAMLVGVAGWYLVTLAQPKEQPTVVKAATKQGTFTDTGSTAAVISLPTPDSEAVAVLKPKQLPAPNTGVVSPKKEEIVEAGKAATQTLPSITEATKQPDTQEVAAAARPALSQQPAAKTGAAGKPITGKIVDAESYPLDNISLQVKGSKNATLTDELGRFALTVPDSNATIIASAPGYKTKEVSASYLNRNNNLKLEKAAQSLDEMVVIGYANRSRQIQEPEMDTTEAVPAGGWQNFINYIEQHKTLKHTGKQPKVVVISFEIDKAGKPSEFDIIQSAGVAYDNEATQLLKAGPGWVNKTKNPYPAVKLTITF